MNKNSTPPNLLRGILISCLGAILIILVTVWFTINYQVEQLVINRTSEYAHSIAKLAADSSAEALLSEDILQLNLLVENVARDPYIKQATIFSEDGQVVSLYPMSLDASDSDVSIPEAFNQESIDKIDSTSRAVSKLQRQQEIFIAQQNNIPFIEKIAYQNITAGWFKLEIDRNLLEEKFRESFVKIQLIIGSVSLVAFSLLLFIVFRFESSIRGLANYCQHLLVQNRITPAKNKKAWLASIKELSESHPQQLKEHIILPHASDQWVASRKIDQILVCFIEFSLPPEQDNHFAEHLTQAENYLSQAVQAYGIQSQGDLLTGCLIPFESNSKNKDIKSSISNALGFVALVKELMKDLEIDIKLRACLCKTSILQFEDEHDLVTGISIPSVTLDKIRRVFLEVQFGKTVTLSINESLLVDMLSPIECSIDELNKTPCFIVSKINSSVTKQNNLKFKHITAHA
ncbi:MAG: hypothetical protein L3J46_07320 [Kangiellaceae bacterium]|nr:hypothetical protein [Kangiellaceae bacterium]